MTELHILCDGYVRELDELRVGSTVGFVRDGEALVMIDPGMVARVASILEPLAALGVDPGGITDVVLSHHHPD
ncbi:MBL fold metallo-hydrolase, partial [Streptococcus suis]|uniref:MBL fold metallo-hydrolase n=1 Tax=Streptococcus suis TaxID=1307 RepID=UPI00211786EC